MPVSKYQKEKIMETKRKSLEMYKAGLTVREIGKVIGKSHTWVWSAVRELESLTELDKKKKEE